MKCFICWCFPFAELECFCVCSHWCVYFQILYNTMDFYIWKLNLIWSCKWIICKRIIEHTYWSAGMLLICHRKFCMCDDTMPKQILALWAFASAIASHSLTGLFFVKCHEKWGENVTLFLNPSSFVMLSTSWVFLNKIKEL